MNSIIKTTIRGFDIKFETRPAVFSRQGLDTGSKLLAENMEVLDKTLIADLGCGSGVLGFIAARQNPNGHVHLLDSNLRAVNLARKNAVLNNLKNVEVFLSDLFSAVSNRTYHLILANPPQDLGNEFLEEIVKESFTHLKDNGQLIWVVQRQIKPVIKRMFDKIFGNCEIIASANIYVVSKAVKGDKNKR